MLIAINIVLFVLFYANILALLVWPVWLSILAILPIILVRQIFLRHEKLVLSVYAQFSLLLGMTVVVITVLKKLLLGQPVADHVLLPLLVAVLALYVLYLYLSWQKAEQAGHFSESHLFWVKGPSLLMSFAVAVVFSIYCLFALSLLAEHVSWVASISVKFVGRGIIPPITMVFFCWAGLILTSKWILLLLGQKLFFQTKMLETNISQESVISNQQYIEQLWQYSSESYLIPKYLNWAIPILGFIGTVLGISLAADGIQRIISSQQGLSQLSSDLGQAIAPLGIAFDTTLVALSLSIVLTLFQTLQQRSEDRILNMVTQELAASTDPAT